MQKFCHGEEHGIPPERRAHGTRVRGERGKALMEVFVAMRKKQVFHCSRDGKLSKGFGVENYGV